jgi:hypothetical protein
MGTRSLAQRGPAGRHGENNYRRREGDDGQRDRVRGGGHDDQHTRHPPQPGPGSGTAGRQQDSRITACMGACSSRQTLSRCHGGFLHSPEGHGTTRSRPSRVPARVRVCMYDQSPVGPPELAASACMAWVYMYSTYHGPKLGERAASEGGRQQSGKARKTRETGKRRPALRRDQTARGGAGP